MFATFARPVGTEPSFTPKKPQISSQTQRLYVKHSRKNEEELRGRTLTQKPQEVGWTLTPRVLTENPTKNKSLHPPDFKSVDKGSFHPFRLTNLQGPFYLFADSHLFRAHCPHPHEHPLLSSQVFLSPEVLLTCVSSRICFFF